MLTQPHSSRSQRGRAGFFVKGLATGVTKLSWHLMCEMLLGAVGRIEKMF